MLRHILLPTDYTAPIDLENNADTNAYIIDVGYKIKKSSDEYNKLLSFARINSNNESLEKSYQEEINKLKTSLRLCKANFEDEVKIKLDEANASYKDQMNNMAEEISKLKIRNDTAQVNLNSMHEIINRTLNEREKVFAEREKTYLSMINTEKETNRHLSNISANLSKQNVASSAVIGTIGEEMIHKWVAELFNSAEINDQSHLTAKCDLRVKLNNKLFLLEIKNKTTIVKSDIDKFVRDITENSKEIHGGLFISINTPAIPNKGDFSLEYVNDVPCIYAYIGDKQTLRVAIKTLLVLNNKTDTELLTMIVNSVYAQIGNISTNASALEKNLSDSRSTLDSMKKEIRSSLQMLEDMFDSCPEAKFAISSAKLDFTENEIKIIRSASGKLKIAEYAKLLGVSVKYLQDRGGAAKIKSLLTDNIPELILS